MGQKRGEHGGKVPIAMMLEANCHVAALKGVSLRSWRRVLHVTTYLKASDTQ
jgi:hypothetical protein